MASLSFWFHIFQQFYITKAIQKLPTPYCDALKQPNSPADDHIKTWSKAKIQHSQRSSLRILLVVVQDIKGSSSLGHPSSRHYPTQSRRELFLTTISSQLKYWLQTANTADCTSLSPGSEVEQLIVLAPHRWAPFSREMQQTAGDGPVLRFCS